MADAQPIPHAIVENNENAVSKLKKYGIIVVCIIIFITIILVVFYTTKKKDAFIVKTIKSATDSDKVFDVKTGVNELILMQEDYLKKLNIKRNF